VRLDTPLAGLELELERVAEQPADVLLVRPLARVHVFDERSTRPRVCLLPVVGRPRRERQPAAWVADARQLGGGALVVGSEDRAEDGSDRAELPVRVRKILAVALVEADREALLLGGAAGLGELVRGDVDAGHVRAGPRGSKRHAAGPAGDIEKACPRRDCERPYDAIVDRRKGLCHALVARAAPGVGGRHAAEHTDGMGDLFSEAADRRASEVAPLAQRLRPTTLDEFVGQSHVLGEGSALRRAIEGDRVHSSILYGPPGSGKTTLARIVAASTGAAFE